MKWKQAYEAFERDFYARALAEHRGNITETARAIGKYRTEIYSRIKKYGLDRYAVPSLEPMRPVKLAVYAEYAEYSEWARVSDSCERCSRWWRQRC